ncbi:hypothetical protein IE077_002005 [Cardiosporidium cionae]|uniref:Uncharacterized protein n=1 Tax=Cardiosporidium cionae TaxID=476202 RepID=A0ABQ7JBS9_9APIC|nr:hypothetical protein IE077_002005 [Cardiosporidium cionae]|eukprot:KAF8821452.1 hypothetical protein IE077_002005 [Cardiosporidium cionae]
MAAGAYLIFDVASNGSMVLMWSKTPVGKALCFMKPSKNIPEFKYSTNGGKNELCRNCQSEGSRFFKGWCDFLKEARKYNSEITVCDHTEPFETKVIFHMTDNTVKPLQRNIAYSFDNVDAAACLQKDVSTLDVKTMVASLFKEKADGPRCSFISL